MRKILNKKLMMILALLVLVPIFSNLNLSTASAATPKFAKSKIELVGEGEVYQVAITNKVAKSTYKWTSSNKKVVKVSTKGLLTTVGGGSATIRCVIKYPNKKTKTLSCKVTVKIPAEEIRIANVNEVNGAIKMTLGSTIDFERELMPASSTDKTYWSIGNGGDPSCISIDDPVEGIVTAKKAGKVTLVATAASSATASAARKSIINDAIIIEVVGPSATVQSAEIISTTEVKVIFDSAVNPNTVIGLNNKLTANIEVLRRKDTKGVLAADPGTLTGTLSTDGKTLTITSSATFGGEYRIVCSSNILTTTGVAMEEYSKALTFIDNYPPTYVGYTLDDTGFKATINFSEPMDYSGLSVANPTVLGGTTNASATTLSILGNRLNYEASADKKSLVINLSNITTTDYGKTFSVVMAGLKDLAGNSPVNYTVTVLVSTDNSLKPQAVPMIVNRTGYNMLTATFNRAISYAGYIQIKNGNLIQGVIDTNDNKKVNYQISDADAALTGYNLVKVVMWNSFNVVTTDNAAQLGRELSVDFTIDRSNPVLLSYEYDTSTTTLTLTYNKEVILANATGAFSTTLTTITDEIVPNTNVSYTNVPYTTDKKILKLKVTNMTVLGSYSINLPYGFVTDSYKNPSLLRDIKVSNATGTSTELPGPFAILQNSANLNQISLEFANRLDVASAQNVANYSIPGVTIMSALVTKNTASNGATVMLTLAENSIDVTIERPVKISGVMGYNNTYTPIVAFQQMVPLKDNTKPRIVNVPVFDSVTKNIIKLNFTEQITGTLTVRVTLVNNPAVTLIQSVTVSGNSASILLTNMVSSGTSMKIEVVSNALTDTSGNAAALDASYFVAAIY
ncbi:MAG: hypothetical protein K0R34_1553 [Herbinix sp.]|nr:hypothetical protein [Herbinix sp.]